MNMKFLLLALLVVLSLHAHAQSGLATNPSEVKIPVDFSEPVEMEIEIEVPGEQTPIGELSQYLDQHGFSLHIKAAFEESGQDLKFKRKVLHARRFGIIHVDEFNAISSRVSELSSAFAGNPKWTFRQHRKSS